MFHKFVKFLSLSLLAVIPVAASLSSVTPAAALEPGDLVFRINPAEQTIDLAPGQHFTGVIKVQNTGRLGINIDLLAKPFQVLNDNYDPDFATENSYTKLHNWITFPETHYYIEPGATAECLFEVDVPLDVPGGGQYAAIMIETADGSSDDATFRQVNQLASLVYAHVAGEEHIGGVLMAHKLPHFLLGSPFTASATVKNDGNIDFRLNHTLTIYDFFTNKEVFVPGGINANGETIGQANPIILPATSRTNTLTWEGAPQLGVFRAVQTISFLDQNYTYEQIVIICPIWLAGIVLFFIILMVIWIISRVHARKRKQPQVM